jgi:hypothetical protein
VNGFVMMPSLFRSSFLSGWTSPFASHQRKSAAHNRMMSSSSRRRTFAERRAWMGVDDENKNTNPLNNNVNDSKNNEAMKSFDDTVDENMELLKYRIARNRALGKSQGNCHRSCRRSSCQTSMWKLIVWYQREYQRMPALKLHLCRIQLSVTHYFRSISSLFPLFLSHENRSWNAAQSSSAEGRAHHSLLPRVRA